MAGLVRFEPAGGAGLISGLAKDCQALISSAGRKDFRSSGHFVLQSDRLYLHLSAGTVRSPFESQILSPGPVYDCLHDDPKLTAQTKNIASGLSRQPLGHRVTGLPGRSSDLQNCLLNKQVLQEHMQSLQYRLTDFYKSARPP